MHASFAPCQVINNEFVMIKATVSVKLNKCCSFMMFGFFVELGFFLTHKSMGRV